ncbi:MAG: protein kinase [Kiritimatiellae bacterium]|nr:protein kinase [Kiritimatiellia bacterium]
MKLVFTSGPLKGQKINVEHDITLGRGESNDVHIPDRSISVIHCQIHFEEHGPMIKDLGSTNGLCVNGERIVSADLKDGDTVGIGQSTLRVEISAGDEPLATIVAEATPMAIPCSVKDEEAPATQILSPKPDVEELSGNIFGRVMYFLTHKIADGGMGSVYKAEQFGAEGFIKTVAIKTILPVYVQRDNFVSAFVGEAKLVANLVHQNIVQIHHLGRHDNGYYIAMEYIDGWNLTRFLMRHGELRRKVPIEIATFIVSRICRGLEYAHNKRDEDGQPLGLVHRDVSPNNIMITNEGEVKLTDFGVAKAARFMEDDGEYLVGSVEYMSPEQAACRDIDGRSDLFSLGLVFYELLTGIRIFKCHNNDIEDTLERVKKDAVPDPCDYREDIPDPLVTILMKCLEKKASKRWSCAGELGHALEAEMYSRGYGPTIVTLAKYMEDLNVVE